MPDSKGFNLVHVNAMYDVLNRIYLDATVQPGRNENEFRALTDMVDASNMKLSAEMALVNARISMLYNFYTLKYVTNTL